MSLFSGRLDGHPFSANHPFVVLAGTARSTSIAFDTKREAWDYIAAMIQRDPRASMARLYEFTNGEWRRLPSEPAQLQRYEVDQCAGSE